MSVSTSSSSPARFQPAGPFARELQKRVRTFIGEDLRGRFADRFVWAKALGLIAVAVLQYVFLLALPFSGVCLIAQIVALSWTAALVGMNVMHEAAHGNFSPSPWVNRALGLSMDAFGVSFDLYRIKHIQFHHAYTNIHGLDGDISETPLIRLSPTQARWPVHRFQLWYTLPLYGLITISWFFNDLRRLVVRRVGGQQFEQPSLSVRVRIVLLKVIHLVVAIGIPSFLGFSLRSVLLVNLVFHLSLGIMLSLVFQSAHVVENLEFPSRSDLDDWYVHQLRTTADFAPANRAAGLLMGGLNFQVIHHLFPNVSYRHYPEIRRILLTLAPVYGVPYHQFGSLGAAIASHLRLLEHLGRRKPAESS